MTNSQFMGSMSMSGTSSTYSVQQWFASHCSDPVDPADPVDPVDPVDPIEDPCKDEYAMYLKRYNHPVEAILALDCECAKQMLLQVGLNDAELQTVEQYLARNCDPVDDPVDPCVQRFTQL